MYPDPPTWCSIMHEHRSKRESQAPHYPRSTYFNSDPSDTPPIDGVVGSFTSETAPFQRNVPKPFPSGLSCDCTNSAKYTLSSRGKVLQVDTKKKWKTRGIGEIEWLGSCR